MRELIPVVDLFAGPGGLGEGFATYRAENRKRATFKILISVEKDEHAHQTLELRSFFRQFVNKPVPDEYYQYLKKKITRDALFEAYPFQAKAARREARKAELGTKDDRKIYQWIASALKAQKYKEWVLIGGPPCQAYSTIGRSRRKSDKEFEKDKKHFLYQEYLQIITRFRPSIFVMENVKGMLSSMMGDENIFKRIIADLKLPATVATEEDAAYSLGYTIYSLVTEKPDPETLEPTDFIIKAEDYGIPQARHRVILLGVRNDLQVRPDTLKLAPVSISAGSVLDDLPALRSALSKQKDCALKWKQSIQEILTEEWFKELNSSTDDLFATELKERIEDAACKVQSNLSLGAEYIECTGKPTRLSEWFKDEKLSGVCNHTSRTHMASDLRRYLFASCYASVYKVTPKIADFPKALLPAHKNVQEAPDEEAFDDRFRVQLPDRPATTITSHISKDGHYNIHFDSLQCRSLTVREAARLQTFPDNYFFEGARTHQYQQVGNAVPPLLAWQIAEVIGAVFEQIYAFRRSEHKRLSDNTDGVVEEKCQELPLASE